MQHDVFRHPVARNRRVFPFVVVLQSDYADGDLRLTAPLLFGAHPRVHPKAAPSIVLAGAENRLLLPQIGSLPIKRLGQPLGSVAGYRDGILRSLDWLFTGI